MTAAILALLLFAVIPAGAWTPVTIVNPKHVAVREGDVNLLLQAVCQVVANEFHLASGETLDFPLTLVLGERDEHLTADEDHGVYIVYLNHWNEGKFATSAMRLAVWRVVPRKRRDELVRDILLWRNATDPVPANKRPATALGPRGDGTSEIR